MRKQTHEYETSIDEVIDHVQTQAVTYDAHSEEFTQMTANIVKLTEAKVSIAEAKPDRLAVFVPALSTLLGIAGILTFESKGGIITSKALPFVNKMFR